MHTRALRVVSVVSVLVLAANLMAADDEPLRVAGDRPADIVHIKLDLKVDIPAKTVAGTATIDLVALRDLKSIRFDAVDFKVSGVKLSRGEGAPLPIEYVNDGDSIEVLLGDRALETNARATVTIDYVIDNPKSGLHFFAPSEAAPDVPYVVWSQGESITNRYWVPCFDHPNEMQTTEMVITVGAGNEVISNGRLVSKKKNADGTMTFHWLQDKPHVSYLMTLVVGEFHVETETWRGKPVTYYVPEKNRDDIERSFGNTIEMLDYFSELTGVEYPWDKYAQVCAHGFGGGMENTSATTLGTWTLHDERAHLDFSSDGLVAHELAHQWFGDYVTCKNWSHLWLNEGFASFMDPMWTEHHLGTDEYDYDILRSMRRGIKGGKKRAVVDRRYKEPRDMFDSRAYPKGASILHMLRRRVGDEMFWASVKHYLTTNAHQPVETPDLRRSFEHVTGRSLERFFYDWTERPGAPSLSVGYKWLEEEKLAEVSVKQTQEVDAFHVPLEIEFRFDEGDPITVRRELTEKNHRYLFPLKNHPSMVLVDPRNAVMMELKEKKGRDLWGEQLSNAPYAINRIRAAKHLGDKGGDRNVELLTEALGSETFWGVGAEIAEALGEAGGDKARDALLEGLGNKHPKVRRACASELGSFHRDEEVTARLYSLIRKGDPSYRVESAAIRSYGKLQPDGATAFLTSLFDRDSHREQIRSAALRALGDQRDASGLDTLLAWSQVGKPLFCRAAAISGLGSIYENLQLDKEDVSRIVDRVSACVKGESRWVKGSAMRALGRMGNDAKAALPLLRDVAANADRSRTRDAAERAIKKITAAEPEKVQVSELREDIEKLQDENEELKERLDTLEARWKSDADEEG